MRRFYVRDVRNLVVKVGTSVLTRDGRFEKAAVSRLASDLARQLRKGVRVSVVSSGAIGSGMALLGMRERPAAMDGLQGAAAVGQRYLMQCYEQAFSRHGFSTAQVLLTWEDLAQRKRYLNAKRTLRRIQAWRVVPIINENDTVATDEIRFGDNDRLSALLSILVEADALIILTDADGLYADGRRGEDRHRFRTVETVGDAIFGHVKDRRTSHTVGGMRSKLEAIRLCTRAGIPVFLADGRRSGVIGRVLSGDDRVGTFFLPRPKKEGTPWFRHYRPHLLKK